MAKDKKLHGNKDSHHGQVSEFLPWYINGTLPGKKMEMVEAHIATCSACQKAFAHWKTIAATIEAQQIDVWSPSAEHFDRILKHTMAPNGI